jgi:hypothetical protein
MLTSISGDVGTLVGTLVGTDKSPYIRRLRLLFEGVPTVPTLFLIPTGSKSTFACKNRWGRWGRGDSRQKDLQIKAFVCPHMCPHQGIFGGDTGRKVKET